MIRPLKSPLPLWPALLCLLYLLLLSSVEINARINSRITLNEAGLYTEDDNVIMLDNKSLPPTLILNYENKLVQFLNSFCGDCQRFAPVFKGLARDLYKWRRILRIYAVDCAQERNVEICREFDIRQTPTLRFFSSDLRGKKPGLGVDINSQDPKVIRSALVEFVSNNTHNSPGQTNFESLMPNATLKSIFQDHPAFSSPVQYIALVHQPRDSVIGRDTLLELLPFKEVAVRIVEDPQIFANFGLEPANQTIVIVDRKGNNMFVSPTEDTGEAYIASIEKFLEQLNFKPTPPLPISIAPNPNDFLDQQKQAIVAQVLKQPLRIYRADLEQAIDKLLHIELPKKLVIEGDNLTALRNFIQVMSHLNPLNKNGQILVTSLNKSLSGFQKLSGAQFADAVNELESPLPKIFKGRRYVGCIATRPFLRGFTCSLWTLFHMWTVEAAKASSPELPPGTVLSAIHGFVKYFFGCSDCSNHFQEMAKRRRMDLVKTHNEEILWLWGAHNEVNERLIDDATEDPQFPKIQFPSQENCPTCKNNHSEWQADEVVKYLRNLYDKENISFYGLPTSQGYD
ncbi:hypothetical protein KR009_010592 [Drosophila setifemur]|nr:hypothetical protein KR009_010592 [Drosophila setifemur]